MKKYNRTILAAAFIAAFGIVGCGSDGSDGADGADGVNGVDGVDGADGTSAALTVSTVENAYDFNLQLDPADIVVVGSDPFSIKFTVSGKGSGNKTVPFSGLERVALYVMSQSANTTDSGAPMLWTSHTLANSFGSSMYCNLTGSTTARDGSVVNACTLVEDTANPGTYIGTWAHEGNAPVVFADGDANDLVRVMIRAYDVVNADGDDISDKILSTPLDFIPATGELAVSEKDSVSNAACINCHGELTGYDDSDKRISKIAAHHNYQKVENCVACHNPAYAADQNDPELGFNPNFNAMIHTIHAGGHLAEWGVLQGDAEAFAEVHFPTELNECTACHDNGDQWKENIYREACVGCHVTVNFETGEGHSDFELPQADDSQCMNCHVSGLSPASAHKVGKRAEYADLLTVDFTSITAVPSATAGMQTLTIKANVTMNGVAVADGTNLGAYNATSNPTGMLPANGLLIGNVDATGKVNSWRDLSISLSLSSGTLSGGVLTIVKDVPDAQATGTIYIGSEANVCVKSGKVAGCGEDDLEYEYENPIGNTSSIKYFDLAGDTVNLMRTTDADRITVTEAKCNSCHGTLDYIKGRRHGTYTFDQCQNCHNETNGASGHDESWTKAEDGSVVVTPDLSYDNKDLVTVSHRFHSGNWNTIEGIYRDHTGELIGYPSNETDCAACHKDGAVFFADDGGLTSGKRAIKVGATSTNAGYYISPVAESCRSCHAHSNGAALAHFKSNGAIVEGDAMTDSDLPVESCATCHAEGKTYGLDKVHSTTSH
ncbi:OmcA/MtrC family decaheme c-type cytochrome [Shewanella basaltis]|uniref:OmcA/MtrC family decaheme c-type cytochrome n=1 Tax=Shewanella basaltis TaxID=472183 RepID=UPI00200BCFFF|nr:OmcA/MtrC family decaheme c-type cytochrome [Shewanella basaltis]MCL1114965.1 OmcA/MtrC family decaheme c-type cytochrome [Shewanella basaltis]